MIHFRIIGSIWLISGLFSAVKFPFELWSMATDQQYGITTGFYGALFSISKLLVEVSFLLILLIGWSLLRNQQTKAKTTHMKTDTVITSVLIALVVSIAQAAPDSRTLQHTLTVTPEIKRAFRSGDKIKIRSVTGTAPKFQTGETYRVVGTCRQKTLKNAPLYLGNTAEAGSDAIAASAGSCL